MRIEDTDSVRVFRPNAEYWYWYVWCSVENCPWFCRWNTERVGLGRIGVWLWYGDIVRTSLLSNRWDLISGRSRKGWSSWAVLPGKWSLSLRDFFENLWFILFLQSERLDLYQTYSRKLVQVRQSWSNSCTDFQIECSRVTHTTVFVQLTSLPKYERNLQDRVPIYPMIKHVFISLTKKSHAKYVQVKSL